MVSVKNNAVTGNSDRWTMDHYVQCDCGAYDHQMKLSYFPDEPDSEMYVHFIPEKIGFWRRIIKAWHYICGDYDALLYAEILMRKQTVSDLQVYLAGFKNNQH